MLTAGSASVIAGAITGAVAGAFVGGAKGALIGALSGALFAASNAAWSGVGNKFGQGLGKAVTTGLIGGATSDASGGQFSSGFWVSFGLSAAESEFQNTTQHAPGWGPGQDEPTADIPAGQSGSNAYIPEGARIPESYWSKNTFGNNLSLSGNGGGWSNAWKQSGFMSRLLDKIPGMQAVSQLHDEWNMSFSIMHSVATMVPATVVTYAALLGTTPSVVAQVVH